MRELTRLEKKKTKSVYQLNGMDEFKKGEWLKSIPNSTKVEVSFTGNNCILIVSDTPEIKVKSVKETMEVVK